MEKLLNDLERLKKQAAEHNLSPWKLGYIAGLEKATTTENLTDNLTRLQAEAENTNVSPWKAGYISGIEKAIEYLK